MTKKEFLEKLNKNLKENFKAKFTKKDVEQLNEVFLETLKEAALGDGLTVQGFFSAKVVERGERRGRNPQTNEEIIIPARKVLKFKTSSAINRNLK